MSENLIKISYQAALEGKKDQLKEAIQKAHSDI